MGIKKACRCCYISSGRLCSVAELLFCSARFSIGLYRFDNTIARLKGVTAKVTVGHYLFVIFIALHSASCSLHSAGIRHIESLARSRLYKVCRYFLIRPQI